MYKVINNQAPLTLVTLDEAKAQLRLMPSFTMDDAYLTGLISAASELAQDYTKRLLTLGSVTVEYDQYTSWLKLPYGHATTITEVLIDDVASTDYTFSTISQKITIGDTTLSTSFSNIKITYDCGFDSVPSKVKQGILMLISTMYRNRDDYITGMTVANMPMTSTSLLNSVRYYGA